MHDIPKYFLYKSKDADNLNKIYLHNERWYENCHKSKANLKRELNFLRQNLGEFDTQEMAGQGKRMIVEIRIVKNKHCYELKSK